MNMKYNVRKLKVVGLMLAAGLVSGQAVAQQSATGTAATQAVVIQPITISKTNDLTFGRLASGITAGSIEIAAADGARTGTSANLVAADGTATAPGRAVFTITGEPGLTYGISAPAGTITLTNDVGGAEAATLVVTLTGIYSLNNAVTATASTASTATLTDGSDTLGIGGSLALVANAPSGIYANAEGIALTVNYN